MKHFLFTLFIALAATVSSSAQTLQVDPLYIGGTSTFEVQNGSPNAFAIICYSRNGSGPYSAGNGLIFDLSMPIGTIGPFSLDSTGNGTLGPFPLPSNAAVGMQVWFQGVQLDIWANPIYSVTNMVPITVQQNPPIAVDDNSSVLMDNIVLIDVLANDSDPDGDAISIVSASAPTNGTNLIVSGQIAYIPSASYVGADSFTYVIEDTSGAQATATVFVDVFNDGELSSWGWDSCGQVSNTPLGNDFIQVAGGHCHSVALRGYGSLISWGTDNSGLVSNTPSGNDFIQVAATNLHSVALRADGSLVSWGSNLNGEVSDTPTGNDFVRVFNNPAGYHSLALRADGSLISWGSDSSGQVSNTPSGNDFIQAAGGNSHSIALKSDGSLISWGSDNSGQVSGTPPGNDFIQVSAGIAHSVALKSDGSLVAWGSDSMNGVISGQVSDTPTTNDIAQVAAGGYHNIGLRSDGSIISWGYDAYNQVSHTPSGNNYIKVAAGKVHSIAIKY